MDFLHRISKLLHELGYRKPDPDNNRIWIGCFGREYALLVLVPEKLPGQRKIDLEVLMSDIQRQENALMIKTGRPVRSLILIISSGLPPADLVYEVSRIENAWILDREDRKLMIFEKQLEDFFGLRGSLETMLDDYGSGRKQDGSSKPEWMEYLAPVNLTFILINITVFILLSIIGDTTDPIFMADHGALVWDRVVNQGEYWRIITSGFLHFGANHLIHNMLALIVAGSRVENLKGHFAFFLIYMISEVISAFCSLMYTLSPEGYSVSAGASGAVFGLIGALLCAALWETLSGSKRGERRIGRAGFLVMLAFALVVGVTSPEVDNIAHIGGLISGIVIMTIMLLIEKLRNVSQKTC